MWSTRTAVLRLAIVILAFMTVWKTLVTHAAVPHRGAVDTATRATYSIPLGAFVDTAHGKTETVRNMPDAALTIPHHLEDLRVFRKSATDSSSSIDHLPLGTGELKEDPASAKTGLDSSPCTPRTVLTETARPPHSEPPGHFRAHLQTWRV